MRNVAHLGRFFKIGRDCGKRQGLVGKFMHIDFAAVEAFQQLYKLYIALHTVGQNAVYRNVRAQNFVSRVEVASGGNIGLYIVFFCGIFAVYGIAVVVFYRNPERPHHIQSHIYVVEPVTAAGSDFEGLARARR